MGKKVKKIAKGALSLGTLGVSDTASQMFGAGESDKAERMQMEAQRAQLNEQALAATNANADQVQVASVIAGGSAADETRKKRNTGAGPVSTSLGINT